MAILCRAGGFVAIYLVLVELAKLMFYAEPTNHIGPRRTRGHAHRVRRRAARFHSVNGIAARARPNPDVNTRGFTIRPSGYDAYCGQKARMLAPTKKPAW